MKKSLLAVVAVALLGTGLVGPVDADAQACYRRGVVADESVRLDLMQLNAIFLQEMKLTVKDFTEFAEIRSNAGGSFCGLARVLIAGNLLFPGALGSNEILVQSEAFLKPGTRLQLGEFVYSSVSQTPICPATAPPGDTCIVNASLYRTATVLNR